MDFSQDELKRELRAGQHAHDEALPAFGAALDEAFDPDRAERSGITAATKAGLLGIDRRNFFKVSGLTVGTAALAAACVVEEKPHVQLAQTGTLPPPAPSTTKPPNPGSATVDATLVLTAISVEKLAIEVYTAAIDAGWLSNPLYQEVAKYFRAQHEDHEGLLASTARQMGQNPDAVPANAYLKEESIDAAVAAIKSSEGDEVAAQKQTLTLAMALEDSAAQTYTLAGGVLTTPTLRQAILSIGAVEARHFTVLATVLGQPPVPFALEHTNGAVPKDSYVAPNGDVRS